MGLMISMNDEVIKKTSQYLERFCHFTDFDTSKQVRKVARDRGIDMDIGNHLLDLAITNYKEAVGLFPTLKDVPADHVEELLETIRVNQK